MPSVCRFTRPPPCCSVVTGKSGSQGRVAGVRERRGDRRKRHRNSLRSLLPVWIYRWAREVCSPPPPYIVNPLVTEHSFMCVQFDRAWRLAYFTTYCGDPDSSRGGNEQSPRAPDARCGRLEASVFGAAPHPPAAAAAAERGTMGRGGGEGCTAPHLDAVSIPRRSCDSGTDIVNCSAYFALL